MTLGVRSDVKMSSISTWRGAISGRRRFDGRHSLDTIVMWFACTAMMSSIAIRLDPNWIISAVHLLVGVV